MSKILHKTHGNTAIGDFKNTTSTLLIQVDKRQLYLNNNQIKTKEKKKTTQDMEDVNKRVALI